MLVIAAIYFIIANNIITPGFFKIDTVGSVRMTTADIPSEIGSFSRIMNQVSLDYDTDYAVSIITKPLYPYTGLVVKIHSYGPPSTDVIFFDKYIVCIGTEYDCIVCSSFKDEPTNNNIRGVDINTV